MEGRSAWIIFDADNTLWPIEHLYDDARESLVQSLALEGFERDEVEAYQRARDIELYATHGYSACRFARSFEDTWLRFVPSAPPENIRHARLLALNIFEQRVQPVEGLEAVLGSLAHEYQLAVVTAGEKWVQERRLNDFHLRDRFAAVEIVEAKTAGTFRTFCDTHFVDPARSWVVGDSGKSDMIPARDAGLGGIHVDHRKNWSVEQTEFVPWDRYIRIRSLAELATVPGLLRGPL
ncbi:HAD family hydrolase [Gemmata sp. G18]|uniref:HAD family hydrolase n=1 Tax=Gemmata palustris TaxID=2822762 RepID=A0ABS5BW93_9BACT|nr:HAD family hydrolase [Gemmata palustris]MBP3957163.1 HAD family hydrolase [Gemmata palustris]